MTNRYHNADGLVGVLISPGHGAGWSTSNVRHAEEMLFDPTIIEMVLSDANRRGPITSDKLSAATENAIVTYAKAKWGGSGYYLSLLGADKLTVEWVEQGTEFFVDEYDGYESITRAADIKTFFA